MSNKEKLLIRLFIVQYWIKKRDIELDNLKNEYRTEKNKPAEVRFFYVEKTEFLLKMMQESRKGLILRKRFNQLKTLL